MFMWFWKGLSSGFICSWKQSNKNPLLETKLKILVWSLPCIFSNEIFVPFVLYHLFYDFHYIIDFNNCDFSDYRVINYTVAMCILFGYSYALYKFNRLSQHLLHVELNRLYLNGPIRHDYCSGPGKAIIELSFTYCLCIINLNSC